MIRKFINFFGSLKVAITLMLVIVALMVVGSFFATDLSNGALRRDFYRSWWFNGLLALFAVSMVCATLKRDPFHLHQIPFVVTHGGILIILLGAMLSNFFKIYGMVSIPEGGTSAVVEIEDEREIRVWVRGIHGEKPMTIYEDFNMYRSSEPNRGFPVEGAPYTIAVRKFVHNAHVEERFTDTGMADHPAARVQVNLNGKRVVDSHLFARPRTSREYSSLRHGPLTVYLKESPVLDYQADLARYADPGRGRFGTIRFRIGAETLDVDVQQNMGKPVVLGVTTVTLQRYIPDIRHLDEDPETPHPNDEEPVNPAVYFLMEGPEGRKQYVTVESRPELSPMELDSHHKKGNFQAAYTVLRREGAFRIYLTEHGPKYLITSRKGNKQGGDLVVGTTVDFPWMEQKLQITVPQLFQKARTQLHVEEIPAAEGRMRTPAIFVEVLSAKGSDRGWVPYVSDGWFFDPGYPRTTEFLDGEVKVQYGSRIFPLDFSMRLEKFKIVHYPGSDIAKVYESQVVVRDGGDLLERTVRVNEPLHHRGFIFYQSNYTDLGDQQYITHFSASWDPGITVVYVGFALLIAGVLGMFYIRPALMKRYRMRMVAAAKPVETGVTEG